MTTEPKEGMEKMIRIAKEEVANLVRWYSSKDYLYSEENHPEEDVDLAMKDIMRSLETWMQKSSQASREEAFDKCQKEICKKANRTNPDVNYCLEIIESLRNPPTL